MVQIWRLSLECYIAYEDSYSYKRDTEVSGEHIITTGGLKWRIRYLLSDFSGLC